MSDTSSLGDPLVMIIDFHADPRTAQRFDVLCARTGENLNHWGIWYADDEAGIVRCHVLDETGTGFRLNEDRTEAVSEERRKAIKIVRKSAAELAEIDTAGLVAEVDAARASVTEEAARAIDDMAARDARLAAAWGPYLHLLPRPDGRPHRYRQFAVSDQMFAEFLKAGVHSYEIDSHPLPDDARVVAVAHDLERERVVFTVESESFAPLAAGERIPEHGMTRLRPLAGDQDYEAPDW